ncbi:hypothetical protein C8J56DRAFT_974639 [Mycena floridula]|nr:hypothetical protein C8J56DRAFT_974639 [Mycena floridula]
MSLKRSQANAFPPLPSSSSRSQPSPAFKRRCLNEGPSNVSESSSNGISGTLRHVPALDIHIRIPNFRYIVDDQADQDPTEPVISSASPVEMDQDEEIVCTKMVLHAGMIHEDSGATILSNAPVLRPVSSIKAERARALAAEVLATFKDDEEAVVILVEKEQVVFKLRELTRLSTMFEKMNWEPGAQVHVWRIIGMSSTEFMSFVRMLESLGVTTTSTVKPRCTSVHLLQALRCTTHVRLNSPVFRRVLASTLCQIYPEWQLAEKPATAVFLLWLGRTYRLQSVLDRALYILAHTAHFTTNLEIPDSWDPPLSRILDFSVMKVSDADRKALKDLSEWSRGYFERDVLRRPSYNDAPPPGTRYPGCRDHCLLDYRAVIEAFLDIHNARADPLFGYRSLADARFWKREEFCSSCQSLCADMFSDRQVTYQTAFEQKQSILGLVER